jgi:hypothetical protein
MTQNQFVKLVLAAVATVFAYFVLGPDGSQQMHQLLLAGTVAFVGLEIALP